MSKSDDSSQFIPESLTAAATSTPITAKPSSMKNSSTSLDCVIKDFDINSPRSTADTNLKLVIKKRPSHNRAHSADFNLLKSIQSHQAHSNSFDSSAAPDTYYSHRKIFSPKCGTDELGFLEYNVSKAELDRENAHFEMSEALITAFEQLKVQYKSNIQDESNTDITIPLPKSSFGPCIVLNSDGRTETPDPSDFSAHCSSVDSSPDLSSDEEDQCEDRIHRIKSPSPILPILEDNSAEGTALALLSHFYNQPHSWLSQLDWVITEQDEVPQDLLPLPDSLPVDPDTDVMKIRGTFEWAPPRPQIIFNIHSSNSRKEVLGVQGYRCCGCGLKVDPAHAKQFHYCDYLGRYFCTNCHNNALSVIPARILHNWDFSRYYVSNFSHALILSIWNEPLFNVRDVNPELYRRVRALRSAYELREQLNYCMPFITTCRHCTSLQNQLSRLPSYWTSDRDLYSLDLFCRVKNGQFKSSLYPIFKSCTDHILSCTLCCGQGFICEICQMNEIIFPFQTSKVYTCLECGNCFHKKCYQSIQQCTRCERLKSRRLSLVKIELNNL